VSNIDKPSDEDAEKVKVKPHKNHKINKLTIKVIVTHQVLLKYLLRCIETIAIRNCLFNQKNL